MRTRRFGLLLLLAGALFWLGQGMWAAAGMGPATTSSAASAATVAANAATNDAAAPAAKATNPTPTPTPSASTMLLPSRPVLGATLAAAQGQGKPKGKPTRDQVYTEKFQKPAPSEIKAAAQRLAAMGMKPGVAGRPDLVAAAALTPGDFVGTTEGPGGIPHYFGPYGNWAFSPLPKFGIASIDVISGGSGYTAPVVTITDVYGTGTATATAVLEGGVITGFTGITEAVDSFGFHIPFVTITDDTGSGAEATAILASTPKAGTGMQKFVDKLPEVGLPGGFKLPAAVDPEQRVPTNVRGQYLPLGVPTACQYTGAPSDCYSIALVEYTEQLHRDLPLTKLRGYVQIEPPTLDATAPAPAGSQHVMLPGITVTLTDPATNLPVPVPVYAYDRPHYLGPIILAQGRAHGVAGTAGEPRPVRVTFYNLLPTNEGGDLFIPVDETIPGAGVGPGGVGASGTKYKQNRATVHLHGNNTVWISDGNTHQWITPANEDTPYPAGASARSVPDMPGCDAGGRDGNNVLPGNGGCMTFYYTNAQSARLQFYHDHAHGITRLNVYVGEAGGYVLTDAVEQDLINGTNVSGVHGIDPATGSPLTPPAGGFPQVLPGLGIPLVIQDRTFVEKETVFAQDPTWNWGTGLRTTDPLTGKSTITEAVTGDLWYPHVYMTVQSPTDLFGGNPFGKWHYGPWFNPPVPDCNTDPTPGCIEVGVVPNEYYQPDPALPNYAPWEPPTRPGVPNPSLPGESFMDTPLVNGTAYPYIEVEPKSYRFRVLNASNDRFLNLSLYVAGDKTTWAAPRTLEDGTLIPGTATVPCNGSATVPVEDCTEMAMVPVQTNTPNQFADTPSGIPNPAWNGPSWWMIGTEGGFMPKPVEVAPTPIGWNLDMGYFAFGIVNQHSLFLGAAERADVVVDFSAYAGQTLILYNDSPAPVPAGAGVYDFFTGDGDQVDAGGAPNTIPGYGPNTRTVMQFRVGSAVTTPAAAMKLADLETAWAKTDNKRGVFELTQDQIVVPQAAYDSAYNAKGSFPTTFPAQHLQIADTQMTFKPLDANGALQTSSVTIPLEMKAMHDEMGGVYDTAYGRMSGMLGLVNPNSNVHLLIPYGYGAPPTDLVKGSLESTLVGSLADGTQIWRIFHNGVDTHPIHTHLFHAQLINRVDQSGLVVGDPVDVIEHGWKDTVRVNPLEVTFLALRPTVPLPSQVSFEVPDSIRLIDPGLPEGAQLPFPAPAGWFDTLGNQLEGPDIPVNHYVNFGWEYVWHCHILSHEEMDMMHSLVFAVPPYAPTGLVAAWNGSTTNPRVLVNWTDTSIREAGFTVQRATDENFTTNLISFPGFTTPDGQVMTVGPSVGTGVTLSYTDTSAARNSTYYYRVLANGAVVGDTFTPNFPTMTAFSASNTSLPTRTFTTLAAPTAPTSITAQLLTGPQIRLTWVDAATNETGFVLERCTGATCTNFAPIASPPARNNTGNVTYTDTTVTFGNSYLYRVKAINGGGSSAYATLAAPIAVPGLPAAPASLTVSVVPAGNRYAATLNWSPVTGAAGYTIQRATDMEFTVGLTTATITSGTTTTLTQTGLARNTVYYYRIRANNGFGGSSFWTRAIPFPIRTGA